MLYTRGAGAEVTSIIYKFLVTVTAFSIKLRFKEQLYKFDYH